MTHAVDENGWSLGLVSPLEATEAFSLFSPESPAIVDEKRWSHQARTFFDAELALVGSKSYPSGASPITDRVALTISVQGSAPVDVTVITLPVDRTKALREAATRAVITMGGAGFDALLTRAKRIWQVRVEPAAPEGRALLSAAILASTLLAPILAPDGSIFGVKGARERLEALRSRA